MIGLRWRLSPGFQFDDSERGPIQCQQLNSYATMAECKTSKSMQVRPLWRAPGASEWTGLTGNVAAISHARHATSTSTKSGSANSRRLAISKMSFWMQRRHHVERGAGLA